MDTFITALAGCGLGLTVLIFAVTLWMAMTGRVPDLSTREHAALTLGLGIGMAGGIIATACLWVLLS